MKKLNLIQHLLNLSFLLLSLCAGCNSHFENGDNRITYPVPMAITIAPTSIQTGIITSTPTLGSLAVISPDIVSTITPQLVPSITLIPADEPLNICTSNEQGEAQKEIILFTASWDGDNEIYSVQIDGSSVEQLTDNQIQDVAPLASPNGQRIAFTSFSDLNGEMSLYVTNPESSFTEPILIGSSLPFGYAWSPDSNQLVFNANDDIWVVQVSDLSYINLTHGTILFFVNDLAWSPDNSAIAFSESVDSTGSTWHIRTIALDEPTTQWLPSVAYRNFEPVWHPQGDLILFVSKLLPGYTAEQLYQVKPNGDGLTQLTNTETYKSGIAWSANGQMIVYKAIHWDFDTATGPHIANYSIHLLTLNDNTDPTIFESAEFLSDSGWSSNNRYLAFLVEENGINNLYVADICQKKTLKIVENVANYTPDWMP